MKKIAILNNKGGVGKSTVSVNLAHGLAIMGFKTVLIDLDGQNDSSLYLGCDIKDDQKTFYDLFDQRRPANISECLIEARENLMLISNRNIKEIDAELHREPRIDLVFNEKLDGLKEMGYEYVIVDCGAQKTRVNDAVLCYIDHVIMPVQLEIASVRAVGNIYEYFKNLRVNPNKIVAVIPNMYDQRTNNARDNLTFIQDYFAGRVLVTEPIHRRIRIAEASQYGKTIFEYDEEVANQFLKVLEAVVLQIA